MMKISDTTLKLRINLEAFYYRAYGKDFEHCVTEIRKRLDFLCLYDSDIEKAKNKAKEILGI